MLRNTPTFSPLLLFSCSCSFIVSCPHFLLLAFPFIPFYKPNRFSTPLFVLFSQLLGEVREKNDVQKQNANKYFVSSFFLLSFLLNQLSNTFCCADWNEYEKEKKHEFIRRIFFHSSITAKREREREREREESSRICAYKLAGAFIGCCPPNNFPVCMCVHMCVRAGRGFTLCIPPPPQTPPRTS